MSIIKKSLPMILGLGIITFGGSIIANADSSINTSSDMPKEGGITVDDNGNVTSATSPVIMNKVKQSNHPTYSIMGSDTKIFPDGRWTWATDHHNIFNGYKRGMSSYINYNQYHGTYSAVGGHGDKWRYASANEQAISWASGQGTAVFHYGNF